MSKKWGRKRWQSKAALGLPDKNQPEIQAALEAQGWSVQGLTGEGDGVCDLLVGIPADLEWTGEETFTHPALAVLVEVKMPLESKSMKSRSLDKRGLNEKQVAFWDRWHGPKFLVRFPEDAVRQVARYIETVREQADVRLSKRWFQQVINKVTGCELRVGSDEGAIFRAPEDPR